MSSKVFVYLLTDSQLSLDFALAKGMQSYLELPEDNKLGPAVLSLWAGLGTGTLFWGTAEFAASEMKDVGLGARPCVLLWAPGVAAVTGVCCSSSVTLSFCPSHTWGTVWSQQWPRKRSCSGSAKPGAASWSWKLNCVGNPWWECCPELNNAVKVVEMALLGMAAPPGRIIPGPSPQ